LLGTPGSRDCEEDEIDDAFDSSMLDSGGGSTDAESRGIWTGAVNKKNRGNTGGWVGTFIKLKEKEVAYIFGGTHTSFTLSGILACDALLNYEQCVDRLVKLLSC